MKIERYDREDMFIYDSGEFQAADIEGIFFSNPDRTIYIKSEGKLIGIITIGDYVRHLKTGGGDWGLAQTQFTFLERESLEEINRIFENHPNIISIPILNQEGFLVCEYVKLLNNEDEEAKYEEILKSIEKNSRQLREALALFGVSRLFIVSSLPNSSMPEILLNVDVRNIFYKYVYGIKPADNILIVDTLYRDNLTFLYERYFYNNGFQYLTIYTFRSFLDVLEPFLCSYDRSMEMLATSFSRLVIAEKQNQNKLSELFDKIVNNYKGVQCHWLNKEFLTFNNKTGWLYSKNGKEENAPEIVLTFRLLDIKNYIKIQNKKVPAQSFFSLFYRRELGHTLDYDIAYNIIPQLQKNGVHVLALTPPDELEIFPDEEDRKIIHSRGPIKHMKEAAREERDEFCKVLDYGEISEDILEEAADCLKFGNKTGFLEIMDYRGRYFNILSGCRFTKGNPKDWINRVFLFGPCIFRGTLTIDEETIGSILQEKIGDEYCVLNLGSQWPDLNFKMRQYRYRQGDIVVILVYNEEPYLENGIKLTEVNSLYKKQENKLYAMWDEMLHINRIMAKQWAEFIYLKIKSKEFFNQAVPASNTEVRFTIQTSQENIANVIKKEGLLDWYHKIKSKRGTASIKGPIGVIVMNCNPFTKGHRYLIERALSKASYLYIFVVEENRSFFSFEERMDLVVKGTSDLKNVLVFPSGRKIISMETLPGYFEKEALQEETVDMAEDIELFAKRIAPLLGITIRFVGEEPLDMFTFKYNETMKQLLPLYGIKVVEIPRLCVKDRVISASEVRRCLDEKDFSRIRELVPASTFQYLVSKYQ